MLKFKVLEKVQLTATWGFRRVTYSQLVWMASQTWEGTHAEVSFLLFFPPDWFPNIDLTMASAAILQSSEHTGAPKTGNQPPSLWSEFQENGPQQAREWETNSPFFIFCSFSPRPASSPATTLELCVGKEGNSNAEEPLSPHRELGKGSPRG